MLDIIEDFIAMEGYKFLRLVSGLSFYDLPGSRYLYFKDGDTKSSLRQKDIDEFNKPGSDYFIYILTTRAGEYTHCTATIASNIVGSRRRGSQPVER